MLTKIKTYRSHFAQTSSRTKALFAIGFISLSWGTTWVISRQGVKHMPPLQLASTRQLLAGLICILYFAGKKTAWPKGKEWNAILLLSFLNFVLTNGLTTLGVKYISGGLAAIIAAIYPLWIVLIGLFDRRRVRISPGAIVGMLLGFAGICVIFYDHLKEFLDTNFRYGIVISLTASLTWAIATICTRQQARHFNPYFSVGLQMLISGTVLFIISGISGNTVALSQVSWQTWSCIAYLVVFGSVLSFFAYLYALQRLPTAQVSIYAYINPVVAVLLGSLVFSERLTLFIAAGGFVTLFGIFLVNESFRKKTVEEDPVGEQD